MKVICLSNGSKCILHETGEELPPTMLCVGSVYNVIGTESHDGLRYYELEEIPRDGYQHLFEESLFAPLSDIDERELVNSKEEVYV